MSMMVKDLMKDLEKGNRVKEVILKKKERVSGSMGVGPPPGFLELLQPRTATETMRMQELAMRQAQMQQQTAQMGPQFLGALMGGLR